MPAAFAVLAAYPMTRGGPACWRPRSAATATRSRPWPGRSAGPAKASRLHGRRDRRDRRPGPGPCRPGRRAVRAARAPPASPDEPAAEAPGLRRRGDRRPADAGARAARTRWRHARGIRRHRGGRRVQHHGCRRPAGAARGLRGGHGTGPWGTRSARPWPARASACSARRTRTQTRASTWPWSRPAASGLRTTLAPSRCAPGAWDLVPSRSATWFTCPVTPCPARVGLAPALGGPPAA